MRQASLPSPYPGGLWGLLCRNSNSRWSERSNKFEPPKLLPRSMPENCSTVNKGEGTSGERGARAPGPQKRAARSAQHGVQCHRVCRRHPGLPLPAGTAGSQPLLLPWPFSVSLAPPTSLAPVPSPSLCPAPRVSRACPPHFLPQSTLGPSRSSSSRCGFKVYGTGGTTVPHC